MKHLTTKEKLRVVLDLCEKYHIKAYEIGGNTPLNTSGVHRILTKEVKNPRGKTVDVMYDYVIKREIQELSKGSPKIPESITQLKEPVEVYGSSIQDMVARQVYKTLEPILSNILTQQQTINRILIKNTLHLDEIKEDLAVIQDRVNKIKTNVSEMQEVVTPKPKN